MAGKTVSVGDPSGSPDVSALSSSGDEISAALRALSSLRLAALSRCRSNRGISFWRFFKISTVPPFDTQWECAADPTRTGRFPGLRLPARFAALAPESATAGSAVTAAPDQLRPCLIHIQRTAFKIGAIQACNGLIGLMGVAHFDKCETARAAGVAVRHQIDSINGSILLEKRAYRRISSGKIQIADENILHVIPLSVFQLCGQDEADQDSQALAGLSKGILSLPLNRGVKLFLLTLNCTRYDAVSKRVSKLNLFCAWAGVAVPEDPSMTADVTGRRLGPSAFRRSECHRSNRHDYVAGWNHYGFQWQVGPGREGHCGRDRNAGYPYG